MRHKKAVISSLVFSLIISLTSSKAQTFYEPSIGVVAETKTEKCVIPSGRSVGVILSTDGVLVVSLSDVDGVNNKTSSPAKDAGIKNGDLIQSFNGIKTDTVTDLTTAISNSQGNDCPIVINRNGNKTELLIKPVKSQNDGLFKIGAWVKDAASGIGTLTFYDPETKSFAALGHGISDPETGKILPISTGNILNSSIVSVTKGEKGIPGELNGIFKEDDPAIGKITLNTPHGIFGSFTTAQLISSDALPIARRDEVKPGVAYILCSIEGNTVEKFEIEIEKIMPKSISSQKGMVIKITDEALLQKTGGIVQGMSGSPIIQNGKLTGAVTHVFLNEPTRGYGIFIENMLKETEKTQ